MASGDEGMSVGAVRLGAGMAGSRVEAGVVRARRSVVATGRGAGRWPGAVRAVEPAAEDVAVEGGAPVEAKVACGTGPPPDEGGTGLGSLRGAELARVPSPRGDGTAGLRLFAAGTQAPRPVRIMLRRLTKPPTPDDSCPASNAAIPAIAARFIPVQPLSVTSLLHLQRQRLRGVLGGRALASGEHHQRALHRPHPRFRVQHHLATRLALGDEDAVQPDVQHPHAVR